VSEILGFDEVTANFEAGILPHNTRNFWYLIFWHDEPFFQWLGKSPDSIQSYPRGRHLTPTGSLS
jgi:hypothetical protein